MPGLGTNKTEWGRPTPDRTLVARMASGDRQAWNELRARYRATVYSVAYTALCEPEEAEAVAARVFTEAWRGARTFLWTHASVSGWLTHLARKHVGSLSRNSTTVR
jgi:DNA-directed RNA polymerase specialized sigma24 family protein